MYIFDIELIISRINFTKSINYNFIVELHWREEIKMQEITIDDSTNSIS